MGNLIEIEQTPSNASKPSSSRAKEWSGEQPLLENGTPLRSALSHEEGLAHPISGEMTLLLDNGHSSMALTLSRQAPMRKPLSPKTPNPFGTWDSARVGIWSEIDSLHQGAARLSRIAALAKMSAQVKSQARK